MTITHDCPAAGCTRQVPPQMLMCRRHWGQVPIALRGPVYRAWDARRAAPRDARARLAHLQACEDATAAVDGREPRELFSSAPCPVCKAAGDESCVDRDGFAVEQHDQRDPVDP